MTDMFLIITDLLVGSNKQSARKSLAFNGWKVSMRQLVLEELRFKVLPHTHTHSVTYTHTLSVTHTHTQTQSPATESPTILCKRYSFFFFSTFRTVNASNTREADLSRSCSRLRRRQMRSRFLWSSAQRKRSLTKVT